LEKNYFSIEKLACPKTDFGLWKIDFTNLFPCFKKFMGLSILNSNFMLHVKMFREFIFENSSCSKTISKSSENGS